MLLLNFYFSFLLFFQSSVACLSLATKVLNYSNTLILYSDLIQSHKELMLCLQQVSGDRCGMPCRSPVHRRTTNRHKRPPITPKVNSESSTDKPVLGLWEETGLPGENPHRHRVNMKMPHRKIDSTFKLKAFCSETRVLTTVPPCCTIVKNIKTFELSRYFINTVVILKVSHITFIIFCLQFQQTEPTLVFNKFFLHLYKSLTYP